MRTVDPAVFRPAAAGRVGDPRACAAPGPAPTRRPASLVRAAFAHRRKSLARSLEHGRPGVARRRPAAPSPSSACAEDARAEALSPEEFAALSAKLQPAT